MSVTSLKKLQWLDRMSLQNIKLISEDELICKYSEQKGCADSIVEYL
jgi:hypothetical protein